MPVEYLYLVQLQIRPGAWLYNGKRPIITQQEDLTVCHHIWSKAKTACFTA